MTLPRLLTWALGTTTSALLLPSLAPAALDAQTPTPTALFRESSVAARGIPTTDTTRIDLLRRIAHAIIRTGDVESALVLGQSLGAWRREVQTDATCRLLADDRFDDAYRLVRRFPNEDRDWARWPRYPFGDELIFWVVRSGGLGEAVAWARALPSPASRAAGLFEIGEALDAVTTFDNPGRHHPLLDETCRDEF